MNANTTRYMILHTPHYMEAPYTSLPVLTPLTTVPTPLPHKKYGQGTFTRNEHDVNIRCNQK